MKCTFSPALTAKPIATGTAGKSAFACLPFADDESSGGGGGGGSGGRRNEPVHERLYSMRSRPEVERGEGAVVFRQSSLERCSRTDWT